MQISILTRLGNEIASKYMNSSASAKHIILTLRFCVSVVLFVYNLLFFLLPQLSLAVSFVIDFEHLLNAVSGLLVIRFGCYHLFDATTQNA